MFVIIDQAGVIHDIASDQVNFSRGLVQPGRSVIELVQADILVGDSVVAGNVVKNQQLRDARAAAMQQEELIQQKIRDQAITSLKAEGKLPGEYDDKNRSKS